MSTLRVTTLQNTSGVEVYTCKAWVNFNGTGTVAIRASGNVSSITDNGAGLWTVNFTNAMPDANFAAIACSGSIASASTTYATGVEAITTTTAQILFQRADGVDVDSTSMYAAFFR